VLAAAPDEGEGERAPPAAPREPGGGVSRMAAPPLMADAGRLTPETWVGEVAPCAEDATELWAGEGSCRRARGGRGAARTAEGGNRGEGSGDAGTSVAMRSGRSRQEATES
jgi:hypothetical protein